MNDTSIPAQAVEAASALEEDFDLRELALSDPSDPQHACADPFGALHISGVRSRAPADPLAELLGELPARPATSPLDAASGAHGYAQGLAPQQPAEASAAAQPSIRALFDGLHAEFDRVVRDPASLSGGADWEGASAPVGPIGPSMEELSRDGEKYPMLCDIVQSRAGIDEVIDSFDPLGRPMPLDGEAPQEVLRLFAPELLHGSQPALPSLTRREHHALSPDSHMPMPSARAAGRAFEEQLEPRRSALTEAGVSGQIPDIDEGN